MSFDRIARPYRFFETIAFGHALQRARVFWIDRIPAPKRVLVVGEGDGRFLCELAQLFPKIEIDCVDVSERMLGFARTLVQRTCPHARARIGYFREDILTWSPRGPYDLLVTHFFLDCFSREEVRRIVSKLGDVATSDAVWLLADFTVPPSRLGRMHAQIWLRLMYCFFRISAGISAKELVDPTPCLRENRFFLASCQRFRSGLLKSEWHQRRNQ